MAEAKHTEFALKALDLAQLFNLWAGAQPLSGPPAYRVELSAPEGPSTGAGAQAVQHIKLVPPDGGATIVAGSANQLEMRCELRTFDHLAELHAQRFKGAAIPLERPEYQELLKRIQRFFTEKGLQVILVDAARPPGAVAEARPGAGEGTTSTQTLVLLFAGVALVVAAAIFFLLSRR